VNVKKRVCKKEEKEEGEEGGEGEGTMSLFLVCMKV